MRMIEILSGTCFLILAGTLPALAADTSKAYNSGILVLLFVGFCALLIVVQLVPALLALFGLTRDAAKSHSRKRQTVSAKKS